MGRWKCKNLNFEYLENKESFLDKIKSIFHKFLIKSINWRKKKKKKKKRKRNRIPGNLRTGNFL